MSAELYELTRSDRDDLQESDYADLIPENPLEVVQEDVGRIVPAIEFRDVRLSFDDQTVLDGISFTVRRGETKIVLGGSGSGKSTIINLILGLLKPDSGQVIIDGEDITPFDEPEMMRVRKKIGMIFQ